MSREDQSAADKARELDRIGREASQEKKLEHEGSSDLEREGGLTGKDLNNLLKHEMIEEEMRLRRMETEREYERERGKRARLVPVAGAAILLAGIVLWWQSQQARVGEIPPPSASAAATVAPSTVSPTTQSPAIASPSARGSAIIICGLPGGPTCPPRP